MTYENTTTIYQQSQLLVNNLERSQSIARNMGIQISN